MRESIKNLSVYVLTLLKHFEVLFSGREKKKSGGRSVSVLMEVFQLGVLTSGGIKKTTKKQLFYKNSKF